MKQQSVEELEKIAQKRQTWNLHDANAWCRDYASAHYENFRVVSIFLSPATRIAYQALYAFARGADWRADDVGSYLENAPRQKIRMEALAEWSNNLRSVYSGEHPSHPAFVALADVVRRCSIEQDDFDAMIRAFERDQVQQLYPTWESLLEYTSGSANPVGRWILRVHGHNDPDRDLLSDSICTGLQLVNFMQDIRSDLLERNRVYLPQEDLSRFGVTEEMLTKIPSPEPVRKLLIFENDRAERLLSAGQELIRRSHGSLKKQLILFHGGGRLALRALKNASWDAGSSHRKVGKTRSIALLGRALIGRSL